MLAVERDPMHLVGTREGAVLVEDFGCLIVSCRCILVVRQRRRE